MCGHKCSKGCQEPCKCRPCSNAKLAPQPIQPQLPTNDIKEPGVELLKGTVNAPAPPKAPTGPRVKGPPSSAPTVPGPRTWASVTSRSSGASAPMPSHLRQVGPPPGQWATGPAANAPRAPPYATQAAEFFTSLEGKKAVAPSWARTAAAAASGPPRGPGADPTPAQAAAREQTRGAAREVRLAAVEKGRQAGRRKEVALPTQATEHGALWISDEAEAFLTGARPAPVMKEE